MSLAEYVAATAPEKAQIAQERGWRLHCAEMRPVLAEARIATARFCDGFTPTHRGEPRNA